MSGSNGLVKSEIKYSGSGVWEMEGDRMKPDTAGSKGGSQEVLGQLKATTFRFPGATKVWRSPTG